MIFFAFSAGFIAENMRENYNEKEQAHKYMQSMIDDLKSDIIMFDSTFTWNKFSRDMTDNLIKLLKENSENTNEIYFLARDITAQSDAYYLNTKTFDQLKSSGGLRLIQ